MNIVLLYIALDFSGSVGKVCRMILESSFDIQNEFHIQEFCVSIILKFLNRAAEI